MVHKAVWNGQECAVKIIKHLAVSIAFGVDPGTPDNDNVDFRRFMKECDRLRKLEHPNIVELYGIKFHEDGYPVIMMELLNGNLRNYLFQQRESLSLLHQLSLIKDIALGLEYLHSQRIVHRDICGENILLTMHQPLPVAKISDFSTSKIIGAKNSSIAMLPYRRGYIPPEFAQFPYEYDVKMDVFMFGVVISQIICCIENIENEVERRQVLEKIPREHPLKLDVNKMTSKYKVDRPSASEIARSIMSVYYSDTVKN